MRKFVTFIGFVALALATGQAVAAVRWADDGARQANQFEFAGRNVSIYYSPTSFSGEARFSFQRGASKPREFTGDQILIEETAIGQLVSVRLAQVPDLKIVSLTVLIPDVNVEMGDSVLFDTRLIYTSHHTTIAGPDLVDGPLQTYVSQRLIGQASSVDFIVAEESGIFGRVTQSPTCGGPVRPGQHCQGPLAGATVQVVDDKERVVGTAVTDERGLFAVRTMPGDYTVEVAVDGVLPTCPDTRVKVPGRIVVVSVQCDTGIR